MVNCILTIVCQVLRQTRVKLVQDSKWYVRNFFFLEFSKSKLKKQFIGLKYSWALNLVLPKLSIYTTQINNLKMPKYKLESSSNNKAKEGIASVSSRTNCDVLKKVKKKKKKRRHKKEKHSKRLSSKSKLSIAKKVELVVLDLSSESDSDVLVVYDSHDNLKTLNAHSNSSHLWKNKDDESAPIGRNFSQGIKNEVSQITQIKIEDSVNNYTSENIIHHLDAGGESSSRTLEEVSASKKSYQKGNTRSRVWQSTTFSEEMADSKGICERQYVMFDVLSYNVLCQEIMEEHMQLYTFNEKTALNWDYRSKLLMEEFIHFNAEVMCLQEVQESHLKTFYNELQNMGYTGIFKQRTGNKNDGVAIYFKNSTFELIDHTTVEYYQPGVPILNRDNVGLIVKLAPKAKPDERIIVATTHLLYNPRRHDVKLAQLQLLLAEVERFAFKEIDLRTKSAKYWPVILTGDMNMEPCTGGYQLLTSGSFQYEGLSSKTLTPEFYGYSYPLGKELVPPHLGVTDTCQHVNIIKQRIFQSSMCPVESSEEDHRAEELLLQIYNGDFKLKSTAEDEKSDFEHFLKNHDSQRKFCTGQLSHHLQLSSVYQHNPLSYDESQVTTFQDRWIVVDYIFYSNDGRTDVASMEQGNLKLVARYKLLSEEEAIRIGPIPNLFSPSDHYPLAAKFALLL